MCPRCIHFSLSSYPQILLSRHYPLFFFSIIIRSFNDFPFMPSRKNDVCNGCIDFNGGRTSQYWISILSPRGSRNFVWDFISTRRILMARPYLWMTLGRVEVGSHLYPLFLLNFFPTFTTSSSFSCSSSILSSLHHLHYLLFISYQLFLSSSLSSSS